MEKVLETNSTVISAHLGCSGSTATWPTSNWTLVLQAVWAGLRFFFFPLTETAVTEQY